MPLPAPTLAASQRLDRAQEALDERDYLRAAELYREVAQGEGPGNLAARQRDRLRAYARFREGLALLQAGQEDQARAILQLRLRDQPDEAFRELGFSFWDAYALAGNVSAACERVRSLAQQREVRVLLSSQVSLGPESICPL